MSEWLIGGHLLELPTRLADGLAALERCGFFNLQCNAPVGLVGGSFAPNMRELGSIFIYIYIYIYVISAYNMFESGRSA